MVPAIGACILLLVFGLHLAAAGQAITATAGAAARAASLQPTAGSALAAAQAETRAGLGVPSPGGHGCTQIQVGLDASAFRPGGTAVVSVTCTLTVGHLTGVGLPGHLTRTVTSRAPIDLYTAAAGGR